MSKKKTTEQFISDAIKVHGDKYDYSKVEYVNNRTKVTIICPIHGAFEQNPKSHINGHDCSRCFNASKNKYDKAIFDIPNSCLTKYYSHWACILERSFCPKYKAKYPTYKDVTICDEWLTLSNFKTWFESHESGYKEGYHLDKDILVKGNKTYSPETCCFVPSEINTLLISQFNHRGELPIGVKKTGSKYSAQLSRNKHRVYLGYFNTPLEAFNAYKTAKEKYIKELAEKYFQEGKITERVYNALMKYEVEITD